MISISFSNTKHLMHTVIAVRMHQLLNHHHQQIDGGGSATTKMFSANAPTKTLVPKSEVA